MKLLTWLVNRWESVYNPLNEKAEMSVSEVHMYDINAAVSRNWWYDKRGNRWPLRDAI